MSRSYKKTPIVKFGKVVSKQHANRKLRKRVNQKLQKGYSDEQLPNAYEVTNQWDINDVVMYDPDNEHIRRK